MKQLPADDEFWAAVADRQEQERAEARQAREERHVENYSDINQGPLSWRYCALIAIPAALAIYASLWAVTFLQEMAK